MCEVGSDAGLIAVEEGAERQAPAAESRSFDLDPCSCVPRRLRHLGCGIVKGEVIQHRSPEPLVLVLNRRWFMLLLHRRWFMLHKRIVVSLLQNGLAKENRPGHELGPRQDARLDDQVFAIATTKDGSLDERKIEAQSTVSLHVSDDVSDVLADSVADDQEKELAAFEPPGRRCR